MLPLTEGESERHERTGSKTTVVLGARDRESFLVDRLNELGLHVH